MSTPARASRVPLDRDRILDAAIAVADEEGIDAVTVRRLAAALDVHFSSLYTHVEGKDAILDGMFERLIEEAAFPERYDDWRDWVRSFADALRALARAHPGAFLVFTRRPASGPLALRQTEGALAAFRRAGFSPERAGAAVNGISLALLGLALNESPSGPVPPPPEVPAAEFPYLSEAAATMADSSTTWDLMVESVIAGLAGQAA